MTDLEISKALALAIGYKALNINDHPSLKDCWVFHKSNWRIFDYRDWNVIGPIAERYNCFPRRITQDTWNARIPSVSRATLADTPQKAIALAVIGAKK